MGMGARSESTDHIKAQRRAHENLHHVGVESTFATKGRISGVSPTLVGVVSKSLNWNEFDLKAMKAITQLQGSDLEVPHYSGRADRSHPGRHAGP